MWIYAVRALNEDHGVSGGRITRVLAQYVHYYHLHLTIDVNHIIVVCVRCNASVPSRLTRLFGFFREILNHTMTKVCS